MSGLTMFDTWRLRGLIARVTYLTAQYTRASDASARDAIGGALALAESALDKQLASLRITSRQRPAKGPGKAMWGYDLGGEG